MYHIKHIYCIEFIQKYNESLDISANIRSKDALSCLEKFREDLRLKEDGFDDTDRFLVKLFDGK